MARINGNITISAPNWVRLGGGAVLGKNVVLLLWCIVLYCKLQLLYALLQLTTFIRTITTDHFVRIIAVDNVCMHYFPFTFSECPIGNDIFGMHNF